ncbi:MAG: radical SAM/SPASM domain-containing protein [Candidatus Loosdrechtia sp.]|uniref:radical SAM protein n=1 Tax=Candidatus Loosdrechtia sp. TaxID=3101272 RepID=UPI003A62B183|nr:MAG: SPASM domain-containing protein [Candidatus Jettenia sp. AMX2]
MHRITNKLFSKVSTILRTTKVLNKPTNAIFEMSNKCNLNCPLCNTGGLKDRFKHIQRGIMSFDIFKSGLDKLLPEVNSILLYNWGEPFLNKDLFQCIEYAYKHNVKTQLSTNMMLYREEIGKDLIKAGLSKLIVSCDGLTQETYEKYRQGGSLKKIIDSVNNIVGLKKELKSETPLIEMQCIIFKFNEDEMGEYKKFWMAQGVNSTNFIRMSYMSKLGKDTSQRLDLVPVRNEYQPYHPYGRVKKCMELYNHVSIDWNGDWYTCCFPSGEKEYRVGNIVTDDFWKTWNGESYRYCRRLLKKRKSEGQYYETMCHDCTGIYPKKETKRFWE